MPHAIPTAPAPPAQWRHGERHSQIVLALMAATLLSSALAAGTVHYAVLLALAPLALLAGFVALLRTRVLLPLSAGVLLFLAYYSLIQSFPIPQAVLAWLSPQAADIWTRALRFTTEQSDWHSISLEPHASVGEALKWTAYSAMVVAGATSRAQFGRNAVPSLLLISGVCVALVTIAHALTHSSLLYGFYEPTSSHRLGPSPFLNPNNLSGYLNICFFAGWALYFSRQTRRASWLLLPLGALAALSLLTASRAGAASLLGGVALVFALLRRSRRRMKQSVGLPLAVVLTVGACLSLASSSERTWHELFDTHTGKLTIASWTRNTIADFPWTGVGRGAFQSTFPHYRGSQGPVSVQYAENFVLQWATEWGVLVSSLAIAAFIFAFVRQRKSNAASAAPPSNAARGPENPCMKVGLLVLLIHNLLDLGLELPGTAFAAAAVIGHLSGVNTQPILVGVRTRVAFGALLTIPLTLAMCTGDGGAQRDRRALFIQHREGKSTADHEATYANALAALASHPADPYIAYVAGASALRLGKPAALPLLGYALERDPGSASPHLALAHLFRSRGATSQALLHLKHAVTLDPRLTTSASLAVRWTDDFATLTQAVPDGPAGATFLVELARHSSHNSAQLSDLALERDAGNVAARRFAAERLIAALRAGQPPCSSQGMDCNARLAQHLSVLRSAGVPPLEVAILEASGLAARGNPKAAYDLLVPNCRMDHDPNCWKQAVSHAAAAHDTQGLSESSRGFLANSCMSAARCSESARWLGQVYMGQKAYGPALEYFSRAAEEEPSARNWELLATAAEHLGQMQRAEVARRRARGAF
jgi:tetratricopeptide (TPR) repeat protein